MRRTRTDGKARSRQAAMASRGESGSRCQAFAFTGHLAPGVLILMVVLSFLAQNASAEATRAVSSAPPAALAPVSAAPPPAAIDLVAASAERADASDTSDAYAVANDEFDMLLVLPTLTAAEIADASIADALANGLRPTPAKKSGFRKRNIDILRTERDVEIGGREMRVRLRVRAKSRETMSVELHF